MTHSNISQKFIKGENEHLRNAPEIDAAYAIPITHLSFLEAAATPAQLVPCLKFDTFSFSCI